MSKLKDLTGMTFGRLKVIERVENHKNRHVMWLCECQCEEKTLRVVDSEHLLSGHTKSCGCLAREKSRERATTHGKHNTKIYKTWKNMKERVLNPNNTRYKNYGERGIKICDEWKDSFESFYNWAMNNGYKEGLTIERKNVNGDYCPENCEWITFEEQRHNKTKNSTHWIEYNGQKLTMKQWSELLNINYKTLENRINKYHWSIEKALTTPTKKEKLNE